jgi:hypothetical protein
LFVFYLLCMAYPHSFLTFDWLTKGAAAPSQPSIPRRSFLWATCTPVKILLAGITEQKQKIWLLSLLSSAIFLHLRVEGKKFFPSGVQKAQLSFKNLVFSMFR